MICPACHNPGLDIVHATHFDETALLFGVTVDQCEDGAPMILWENGRTHTTIPGRTYATLDWTNPMLVCPCGAFFNWQTRVVHAWPAEYAKPKWWLDMPLEKCLASLLNLNEVGKNRLMHFSEAYNCTFENYGDNRYLYLYIPASTPGYHVAVILDQVRGCFQHWSYVDQTQYGIQIFVKYH
jgi:hypothetical protein